MNLLTPRWELIADYPGNMLPVGHVFSNLACYDGCMRLPSKMMDQYPNIFRRLQWWEHRQAREMPEYLTHVLIPDKRTFHKIIKWDMSRKVGIEEAHSGCNLLIWSPEYTYQPSTKKEYDEYMANKPKPASK